MSTGRDDDALSWDGDDDPTLVASEVSATASEPLIVDEVTDDVQSATPTALPEGWNAVGRGSDAVLHEGDVETTAADETAIEPAATSNAALISTGVLAGAYLLYAIGWLIGGLRLQGRATYLVADVMYQGSLWLATLAPVIWFGTVLFTTRRSKAWVRYVWLAAGAVLLVPWPFIMIGAVGL